jgi:regulator of RNase E activity RraA
MGSTPAPGQVATCGGVEVLDFDELQRELYTGVICDVLDSLGYRNQAMEADIRAVLPDITLVGRARTALSVDVYEIVENCYEKEIAWVDALQPGDVAVGCTNRSTRTGLWGELLSTASKARGARGAVMDGYVRDVRRIIAMGFPVFAAGMRPVDSRGRSMVLDYDVPIVCAGVGVKSGDFVFADIDGVVIVPADVAEETFARALEKARTEDQSRADLEAGAYLRDVYAHYGVL